MKDALGRVIDRVKGAKKISKIIVATSTEKEDDDIESFVIERKYYVIVVNSPMYTKDIVN